MRGLIECLANFHSLGEDGRKPVLSEIDKRISESSADKAEFKDLGGVLVLADLLPMHPNFTANFIQILEKMLVGYPDMQEQVLLKQTFAIGTRMEFLFLAAACLRDNASLQSRLSEHFILKLREMMTRYASALSEAEKESLLRAMGSHHLPILVQFFQEVEGLRPMLVRILTEWMAGNADRQEEVLKKLGSNPVSSKEFLFLIAACLQDNADLQSRLTDTSIPTLCGIMAPYASALSEDEKEYLLRAMGSHHLPILVQFFQEVEGLRPMLVRILTEWMAGNADRQEEVLKKLGSNLVSSKEFLFLIAACLQDNADLQSRLTDTSIPTLCGIMAPYASALSGDEKESVLRAMGGHNFPLLVQLMSPPGWGSAGINVLLRSHFFNFLGCSHESTQTVLRILSKDFHKVETVLQVLASFSEQQNFMLSPSEFIERLLCVLSELPEDPEFLRAVLSTPGLSPIQEQDFLLRFLNAYLKGDYPLKDPDLILKLLSLEVKGSFLEGSLELKKAGKFNKKGEVKLMVEVPESRLLSLRKAVLSLIPQPISFKDPVTIHFVGAITDPDSALCQLFLPGLRGLGSRKLEKKEAQSCIRQAAKIVSDFNGLKQKEMASCLSSEDSGAGASAWSDIFKVSLKSGALGLGVGVSSEKAGASDLSMGVVLAAEEGEAAAAGAGAVSGSGTSAPSLVKSRGLPDVFRGAFSFLKNQILLHLQCLQHLLQWVWLKPQRVLIHLQRVLLNKDWTRLEEIGFRLI